MSDLYPTPTRLALLRDIDVGRVVDFEDDAWHTMASNTRAAKVTARVRELVAAGWVERPTGSAYYRLTDAGQAVRSAHPAPSQR